VSERLNRVLESLDVGLQRPWPGVVGEPVPAGRPIWWVRQGDGPERTFLRDGEVIGTEPEIDWEALSRWAESR
jgi:hypothetical protein